MKIHYLKLINRYRSLDPFEQKFFKHPLLLDKIDPICLVGLNGSGKSNLLELLSDIFYEIEIYFLYDLKLYAQDSPKYFAYGDNRNKTPILFEIEFSINTNGTKHHVRVARNKTTSTSIDFYLRDASDAQNFTLIPPENARSYMPLVVAYTSGLNDLLSLPYVDVQDYYAQQVAQEALKATGSPNVIPSPTLFLLNYDTNAAIVVSNFLLGSNDKLKVFRENLRIDGISSFRIVIRLNKLYGNKKVEVTAELDGYIKTLQDCASFINVAVDERNGNTYIFDFVINDTTKTLFVEKFGSALKLFRALTKLNLLNTLCIKNSNRNALRKRREKGQLIKFPQVASLDKIFSIEKIELILTKPKVRTEYEKISDGEHQFIHIVGGVLLFDDPSPERDLLYLLDEPDTHFNPLWRSDFFFQLNQFLSNKSVEFIITTHSPFILSDCHGYNVFKFQRNNDTVAFHRSEEETYGATYENVTEYLFDPNESQYKNFDSRIAKQAFTDIKKLHSDIAAIRTEEVWSEKADEFLSRIRMLGESVDRLYLLNEFEEKANAFSGKK